ncbi:SMI1/KNR4 family protein [Tenacibaculum maritimum]|uniref:SMI1/KNR4 family protein n=1 Tax=Tenacibaculum maritimum TaxID=107401 RepID=UPI0012E48212|nr:SMI1/KNR4 family protein [Tenacibaculum maritimum]CAA0217852.1 conserved hypothetical protein [Tenacibaculum maritimum]CAA0220474.1 conserved hypothetical protein [Tenacibaculum maritimum]CAA0249772.1 conserved hypothetical protein [Tenacibaculum maritimum]
MISLLKEKVETIKKLDKENRYVFSKKVTLDEIQLFEKKYQLTLPDDFRLFVTEVSNGIKDVENNDVLFSENDFANYFADLDDYSHNPYIEFPVIERTRNLTNGFDYFELTNGCIWLAGTGCGNGQVLVIKGKAKGQVWEDELASNSEVIPLSINFTTWIRSKLDNITRELYPNKKKMGVWTRIKNYL